MNFTFSEFWTALQKCRQLNTDSNGGFFSIDAAAVIFWEIYWFEDLESALAELEVSEDPNTAIWTEVCSDDLSEPARNNGFGSVLEYVKSFPAHFEIGPDRWLLRCE